MNKIKLPGFSTISSNGQFHFESGYPSHSHIIMPARIKGVLDVHPNACADFTPTTGRIYLPPIVNTISEGENYHVKRTTRNYIIQVKVPICETRRETEKRLKGILPQIIGEITIDRMA